MLTRALYTLTGPVKLSEDSVSYLNTHFSQYPPNRAQLGARVIEAFRKSVPAKVLPRGKQPALAQSQNRPQQCSAVLCCVTMHLMLTHTLGMMRSLLMWVLT